MIRRNANPLGYLMSLYNMLFGVNPFADSLLKIIGVNRENVTRFRDCVLRDADGDFHKQIVIHTRTGGPHRKTFEHGNDMLRMIPGYVRDADDTFDYTYANFFYEVPIPARPLVEMMSKMGATVNTEEQWKEMITKLNNDDVSGPAATLAAEIGDAIARALNLPKKTDK